MVDKNKITKTLNKGYRVELSDGRTVHTDSVAAMRLLTE